MVMITTISTLHDDQVVLSKFCDTKWQQSDRQYLATSMDQSEQKNASKQPLRSFVISRRHVCPHKSCGKSFTTSGNLSRHKRVHGYIEPLRCPVEGCNCTFHSNNKLDKHMKYHNGSAVQVCKAFGCGKTFSTVGNLNRHIKKYHNKHNSSIVDVSTPKATTSKVEQWSPCAVSDAARFNDWNINDIVSEWSLANVMPSSSASEFADAEPWNPELLSVLVTILDEPASDTLVDEF